MRSPKFPSLMRRHAAARGGERAGDGGPHQQRQHHRQCDKGHHHADRQAVTPLPHAVELAYPFAARCNQVGVLAIEKGSQAVEFDFCALGQVARGRSRGATGHLGDQRFRVVRPPSRRALLDCIEISDEIGPVAYPFPDIARCLSFGLLARVVRVEELPVGCDDIPTNRGLLVAQRRLQRIGLHPCRLDVVDQLARQLVGAIHQQPAGHQTYEYDHTHRGQRQVLPALHGEPSPWLRPGRAHLVDRSTRTTAISSVNPPCACARFEAASMSASTNAGPGRAASERATSSNPSSPSRSLPSPGVPLEEAVGE